MTSATINEALSLIKTKEDPAIARANRTKAGYLFMKRAFDIVISLTAIIALSWLLLIISTISLFTTRGRPFYADVRVGKSGRDIKIYKFRTMYNDAEVNAKKYLNRRQQWQWRKERKVENDPRITSFGRYLRKTSLDELPQLFNILFGSMSLVGVRPMTREELNKNYTTEQFEIICTARPGLTGLWQVLGRNDITFKSGKRQRLDVHYFQKRGFRYDAKLMFLTIPAVLSQKGAM